jgi:transcriptional regulator with XRE-family HTH domain
MPRTSHSEVTSKWVGARLRAARTTVGLTQAELARRLDVKPSYVAAVEAGRENLTIGRLAAIASALGVAMELTFSVPSRAYEALESTQGERAGDEDVDRARAFSSAGIT